MGAKVPLKVFCWDSWHCPPGLWSARLDRTPAEAQRLEGGEGVTCSPGALERLLFVPRPGGGGRAFPCGITPHCPDPRCLGCAKARQPLGVLAPPSGHGEKRAA